MMTLDEITKKVLEQIDASGFKQSGAFNLRHNRIALCHGDSEHIKIKKKQDKPGIDIYIDGKTDGEEVHIPVVVDATGMTDVVYNDFYIEDSEKEYHLKVIELIDEKIIHYKLREKYFELFPKKFEEEEKEKNLKKLAKELGYKIERLK